MDTITIGKFTYWVDKRADTTVVIYNDIPDSPWHHALLTAAQFQDLVDLGARYDCLTTFDRAINKR